MSGCGAAWFPREHGTEDVPLVAYFSAEFGITESLSIFAGGLGILAGDHLKSASDLGVPLVGVGLLYQLASFKQTLNNAGWQQETLVDNDFANLPLILQKDAKGTPLTVAVPMAGRDVFAQIWPSTGRQNPPVAVGYQPRSESSRGRPRHHGSALWGRSGNPHPPGTGSMDPGVSGATWLGIPPGKENWVKSDFIPSTFSGIFG
jgi:hypothetical protein